jgi:hypothetical protein
MRVSAVCLRCDQRGKYTESCCAPMYSQRTLTPRTTTNAAEQDFPIDQLQRSFLPRAQPRHFSAFSLLAGLQVGKSHVDLRPLNCGAVRSAKTR